MQFLAEKMHPLKMEFRDYIQALEHERSKIQVFNKELPLSLELVSQAIEAYKQQLSTTTTEYNLNGQSECSVQTSSDEVPVVFEEFMPIKKRASPDYDDDEDDHDEHHSHKHKVPKDNNSNSNDNKKKSDWLRSVQLWNHDPPSTKEDVPRRASVVEVKRNGGGAFQPFHREESSTVGKANDASNDKAPPSPQVPSTSSTGPVTGDNVDGSNKKEEKGHRKQRRCWSQELHKRFLHALQQLGGAANATPKQIRDLMKVDGLTNDEVKSHLQKFRLHNRRPNSMVNSNANSQATPLFLVGNILFQPPEYAAAVATSSGELTTVTAPSGIYTHVASHPQAVTHTSSAATAAPLIKKLQFKQSEVPQQSNSEGMANQSEGAVNSNSPASSSSTHTTTTTSPSS